MEDNDTLRNSSQMETIEVLSDLFYEDDANGSDEDKTMKNQLLKKRIRSYLSLFINDTMIFDKILTFTKFCL